MDFGSINIFKMLKAGMSYGAERQDLLAQNVANVDTPGYKARDLKEMDFGKLASIEAHRLDMRATNAQHILGNKSSLAKGNFKGEDQRYTYELNPVENNASVEDQMKLISENSIRYQMMTNMYKKTVDLFKIAISNK